MDGSSAALSAGGNAVDRNSVYCAKPGHSSQRRVIQNGTALANYSPLHYQLDTLPPSRKLILREQHSHISQANLACKCSCEDPDIQISPEISLRGALDIAVRCYKQAQVWLVNKDSAKPQTSKLLHTHLHRQQNMSCKALHVCKGCHISRKQQ